MTYTTWIEIDRAALLHNVRALRALAGAPALMAVVKGNAYGHGMAEVAGALHDEVDWFGVNSLDEANGLRARGCTRPVLIMGATVPERLAEAAKRLGLPGLVHLKVETGTNRLGVRPEQIRELARFVRAQPDLRLEGVYTHYANVEDTLDGSYAEHQLRRFREAIAAIECDGPVPIKHSAATAATILYPQTYFNLV